MSRRAERALRESERLKSLVLDATTEMFAYYTPDLRTIWVNRASADSVGKSVAELRGRHCFEIWHQRDRPCEGCPVLQARETGRAEEGETTTTDGRIWHLRGHPVFDEAGELEGLVEFGREITGQKRSEQALREREARLESIFRAARSTTASAGSPATAGRSSSAGAPSWSTPTGRSSTGWGGRSTN